MVSSRAQPKLAAGPLKAKGADWQQQQLVSSKRLRRRPSKQRRPRQVLDGRVVRKSQVCSDSGSGSGSGNGNGNGSSRETAASLEECGGGQPERPVASLQLLACHEDPSFIYLQTRPGGARSPPKSSSADSTLSWGALSSPGSSLDSGWRLGPIGGLSRSSSRGQQNSDYSSASPSCIAALDFCHLSSASSAASSPGGQRRHLQQQQQQQQHQEEEQQQQQNQSPGSQLQQSGSPNTTKQSPDPVYLEDEEMLVNLILRERAELARQAEEARKGAARRLKQAERHSLLSWLLNLCERQLCQEEIFPLASMILDKFLLLQPRLERPARKLAVAAAEKEAAEEAAEAEAGRAAGEPECGSGEWWQCEELGASAAAEELERRQHYLFAACSLLLATKLRQTPRLSVQTLIQFSKTELPLELKREEILEGELLVLAALKWDLAALIPANDFLALLANKCAHLLAPDERRVCRHSQTLLELCLMDSQLSQHSPSMLAMASLAVAIDGLSMSEKSCWRLSEIVKQIHEATHQVNELKQMIEVAFQIESYVEKLLTSTHND